MRELSKNVPKKGGCVNKKYIAIGLIALLVVGGIGVGFYFMNQKNTPQVAEVSPSPQSEVTESKDTVVEEEVTPQQPDQATSGSFVTLAEYTANPSKYDDSKKVYFFHASWCPICQSIEKEITADTSKIPAGVTIIKTDFDSSTALRQKYGVTTQYTFVQVDGSGNSTAKWSATSFDKVLDGIKS